MARKALFLAALLIACGNSKPSPVAAPSASASASASAVAAPTPSADPDFDLAIGEAIELEGTPLPGPANPTTDAIDFRAFPKNKLVVFARGAGLASVQLTDPTGKNQSRSFRITEQSCRKTPLHPTILLQKDERATIDLTDLREVDTLPNKSPVIHAGFDADGFAVYGRSDGHATVLATKRDNGYALYDVFVGPACTDRNYTSVATAIPPGSVGPKGDGTCQRIDGKKTSPAACPDLAKVEKGSKERFSRVACDWIEACGRRGVEGCCVDCNGDFQMKLDRGCALRALRQKTCADVIKTVDVKGCLR